MCLKMNRRIIIVEGQLAFRMRRTAAARRAEAGVQIMILPQLVAYRLTEYSRHDKNQLQVYARGRRN